MEVRLATPHDLPALSRTLARAFEDDPVMTFLFPLGGGRRIERLATFMALGSKAAVNEGTAYTTAELSGGAVWHPPGYREPPLRAMLPQLPTLVSALRLRTPVGAAVFSALQENHPKEPHWYLQILGTEPAEQGRGIGAALMGPVLERCDEEGVPAYLESSKERNVPYYERHGFTVTGELDLPKGGPRLWLMWRDPQPAA
jgi:GNAT superfamily N-acetyltransferase